MHTDVEKPIFIRLRIRGRGGSSSLTLQQRLQPFILDCQIIDDASEVFILTVIVFVVLRSEELFTISGNGVVDKRSLLFREEESRLSCYELATVSRYGSQFLTITSRRYTMTIVHILVGSIEPSRGAMITPRAVVLFQLGDLDLCLWFCPTVRELCQSLLLLWWQ